MRKMKSYDVEGIEVPKYPKIEGWDEDIVETAGFIPLEVRFKQMEQAGYRARFLESEFTSQDVTDMYLNHPEFDITDEDELEDVIEKTELRRAYIEEVKERVRKRVAQAETDAKKSESEAKAKKSESSDDGKIS